MENNTYICSMCHNEYEFGWTDEEANKEAEEIWGVKNANQREDMCIICDDCFLKIHPDNFPKLRDRAIDEIKNHALESA